MDVLLIVDMQEAVLAAGLWDVDGVVSRVNRLAADVRSRGGTVIFVQHDGAPGEVLEPHSPGWELGSALQILPDDRRIRKSLNDSFQGTDLDTTLEELGATRLLIAGCVTEFCVDSTIRSAVSRQRPVIVGADCHTTAPRDQLSASAVVELHNSVWQDLLAPGSIRVVPSREIYPSAP